MNRINKLVIFGVGLIGGSFGLALRKANLAERIVGVGRCQDNLAQALALGAIDEIATTIQEAVTGADLILLAVPVGQVATVLTQIAPYLTAHTIVTDVGSIKQAIIDDAHKILGENSRHFIPGHPIAGAELSGVTAAKADLFAHKKVVLTPLPENPLAAITLVSQLWQACGSQIHTMSAEQHDQIFAAVSHLPHLLAYALVEDIASKPNAQILFSYAASGFRDFTRIAGSHPEMWRDICIANRAALLQELASYQHKLEQIRILLETGQAEKLMQLFDNARTTRGNWLLGPTNAPLK